MGIHYLSQSLNGEERHTYPPVSIALGYFDGVHQGHRKVIQAVIDDASKRNVESAVLTFHPHPKTVLGKEPLQQYDEITPIEKKLSVLESLGVDHIFLVTFDEQLSSLSPQQFVDTYLIPIHVVHATAGFDFSYGQYGKGTMQAMPEYSRGLITTTVIEKWEQSGEKVSSTRVRRVIDEGNVAEATELLTRPYELSGTVIRGDQRGRELGFPTANVELTSNFIVPATGVYFVTVKTAQGEKRGLCNIGYLPTFFEDRQDVSVEVYVLDFDGDLYGEQMDVQFLDKVRDDEKFDRVEDLVTQMKEDEKKARAYFTSSR
ncbi:riboflavin kinase [Geomicrobium sp. JCM 19037]|uniref:bifunctional riboflavin kinase/FAD synthetase n=1 Tax=unclassified Geomicrobium TaxID=2628951 RepID=UPI00045F342A|nr:bifunctional riboflavin kinase/FAD synthetase [Geomicrobium sp. JCM 19037]GAK02012.1 riboflavin kinase [Geomicrobium sp. JCM 19037]